MKQKSSLRAPTKQSSFSACGSGLLCRLCLLAMTLLTLLPPSLAHAQDITTGLVGHWELDETSGTTAADSSVNSNAGTLTNMNATTATTSGQVGTSMNFDFSASNYINAGSDASLRLTNTGTVSAWVRYGDQSVSGSWTVIAGTANHNTDRDGYGLVIWPGNRLSATINSAADHDQVSSPLTYSDNTWHHVVSTWDGSDLRLYVDNAQVNSTPQTLNAVYVNDFNIGRDAANANAYFNGDIDEVRVYNRALSVADIATLYAYTGSTCTSPAGLPGEIVYNDDDNVLQYCDGTQWIAIGPTSDLTSGLVGHWDLDETTGSAIADSSGNGNNGTWADGSGDDVAEETSVGSIGDALTFDGTDDIINAGSAGSLDDIWTDGGALSAWIYPITEGEGTYGRIAAKGDLSTWQGHWHMDGNRGSAMSFSVACGGSYIWWRTNNNTVPLNQWSHVAIVYDSDDNSNAPTFYVNGSPVAFTTTGSCANPIDSDAGLDFTIGNITNINRTFDGIIDEVRIYNRALSAFEISSLHAMGASCTEPSTTNLVGHWEMDETTGNTIADSSGNGNTGTWADGVNDDVGEETTAASPTGAGLMFDGTDDFITVPHSPELDISTGYTYSSWAYFDSTDTGDGEPIHSAMIAKNYPGGWGHGWIVGRRSLSSGGNVEMGISHDHPPSSGYSGISDYLFPDDTWNYVTVTWDGANIIYYLNGVPVDSDTATAIPDTNTGNLLIGEVRLNWWHDYFQGGMDDTRLYNRALTPVEIRALYGTVGGTCTLALCSNPFGNKGEIVYNTDFDVMQYCNGGSWIAMGPPGDGGAACANPVGLAGTLRYDEDSNVLMYCEGDAWMAVAGH